LISNNHKENEMKKILFALLGLALSAGAAKADTTISSKQGMFSKSCMEQINPLNCASKKGQAEWDACVSALIDKTPASTMANLEPCRDKSYKTSSVRITAINGTYIEGCVLEVMPTCRIMPDGKGRQSCAKVLLNKMNANAARQFEPCRDKAYPEKTVTANGTTYIESCIMQIMGNCRDMIIGDDRTACIKMQIEKAPAALVSGTFASCKKK
jgi:hypothetical protein